MLSALAKKMKFSNVTKIFTIFQSQVESFCAYRRQYSKEEIEIVQTKRLRDIVAYAYESIPFYREEFDARGIHPRDIRNKKDISLLPIITKDILATEFTRFLPTRLPPSKRLSTSGSTGKPTTILQSADMKVQNSACTFRGYRSNGLSSIGERHLVCPSGDLYNNTAFSMPHEFGLHYGLCQTSSISSHCITGPEDPILQKIAAWNPTVLWADPVGIEHLGRMFQHSKYSISPNLIVTIDLAVAPFVNAINELFPRAKIMESYGSYEVGEIGFTCPESTGFHLNEDFLIVEVVPCDDLIGDLGEVVVTNLMNRSLPLFRYNLEDLGVLDHNDCSCGSNLVRLKELHGRHGDCIKLSNGKIITPYIFIGKTGVLNTPAFSRYRVIQETQDHLRIQYVKSEAFSESSLSSVEKRLKTHLGEYASFKLECVSEIVAIPGKKYNFIQALA